MTQIKETKSRIFWGIAVVRTDDRCAYWLREQIKLQTSKIVSIAAFELFTITGFALVSLFWWHTNHWLFNTKVILLEEQ